MSTSAGASQPRDCTPKLAGSLFLFAISFSLGVCSLFVHVNTTAALVRALGLGRLATLPLGLFMGSATVASIPLDTLVRNYGRQRVAPIASLVGVGGALMCYGGALQRKNVGTAFALLIVGSCLQGVFFIYALSLRFAAASICPPAVRARCMSLVVGAASISGVVARELSVHGRHWLEFEYSGSYVFLALLCVAAVMPLAAADFTPFKPSAPAEGNELSKAEQGAAAVVQPSAPAPFGQLVTSPHFLVAALSTAITYTTMASLMSATPVRMLAAGFPLEEGATVVQYHVIAMYVPCLLTGDLIRLLGAQAVILLGYGLLIVGISAYTFGSTYANFLVAMVIIGVGWNLAFLGASALTSLHFKPADMPRVQLANDAFATAMLSVGVATATVIFEDGSWEALLFLHISLAAFGAVAISLYAAFPLAAKLRRSREAAGVAPAPAPLETR